LVLCFSGLWSKILAHLIFLGGILWGLFFLPCVWAFGWFYIVAMIRLCFFSAVAVAVAAAVSFSYGGEDWPRFLGPEGNNHSGAKGLPLEWSEKKNVKWKTLLPGEGWSSPVVGNGRIYCTTALDDGRSLRALCVEFATGKVLWDVEVFANPEPPVKHKRNSHASPTPLLEGERLFVTFGPSGTACLSVKDGAKIWENRELKWDVQNGPGGSVAGAGELLLVPCDGIDVQFEAALSKKDGKVVWKSERSGKAQLAQKPTDMHKAYGTPVVLNVEGKPVSVTTGAQRLYGLDPATGRELWHVNYPGFSNVPVPQTDGRNLYVATGFQKAELWAVKLGGAAGDVTGSHVLWKQIKGAPTEATPLVVGDRVYTLTSGGIGSCINSATGEVVWQNRVGGDFAATPLHAEGRIYAFDAWGRTDVFAVGDVYKQLASNKLSEGCMASPAVVGKALVVRTKAALYRIEE
jgi:outer membrane protein assembly factor BamB